MFLKRVYQYLKIFFYSLPFGLKGGNELLFNSEDNNSTTIQVTNNEKNLGDSLLKGEVTQEVEELRYKTYKVAKESDKYIHLGEGVSIKKKEGDNLEKLIIKNSVVCEGVFHELLRVNEYGVDRYKINIKYRDIPRFKIEKYAETMEVELNNKIITFFVEKNTDKPERRMFYNELEMILNGKTSDLAGYPFEVSFFTENTFNHYTLIDLKFINLTHDEYQYVLKYDFNNYVCEDFVEKYYSNTMNGKYESKEQKSFITSVSPMERVRFCSECGAEINTHDGDITEQTFNKPLCVKCLEKIKKIQ